MTVSAVTIPADPADRARDRITDQTPVVILQLPDEQRSARPRWLMRYDPEQPRDEAGRFGFLHHVVVELAGADGAVGFALKHDGEVSLGVEVGNDGWEIGLSAEVSADFLALLRNAERAEERATYPAPSNVFSAELDNAGVDGAIDIGISIDLSGLILLYFDPQDESDALVEVELTPDDLGSIADGLQEVEDVAKTNDLRSVRRYSATTVRERAGAAEPQASPATPELDVVRDVLRVAELRADAGRPDDILGTVYGHFSVFDAWYPIRSWWEGDFVERVSRGAFVKTMRERRSSIVTAFDHGFDPQIGDKVLGPLDELREDKTGGYYEIGLLDTSYNRDLMPGLKRGLYGASFRFAVVKDEWNNEPERSEYNPEGLPERTIKEVRLYELGPVTYPASPAATSAMRSGTDTYYERLARRDPARVDALRSIRNARTSDARPALGAAQHEPIEPRAAHSAGLTARERRERLYPTLKGA